MQYGNSEEKHVHIGIEHLMNDRDTVWEKKT
jgi:hypothetical protein